MILSCSGGRQADKHAPFGLRQPRGDGDASGCRSVRFSRIHPPSRRRGSYSGVEEPNDVRGRVSDANPSDDLRPRFSKWCCRIALLSLKMRQQRIRRCYILFCLQKCEIKENANKSQWLSTSFRFPTSSVVLIDLEQPYEVWISNERQLAALMDRTVGKRISLSDD